MKNRIYFFTGTGNSLKVAKDIAETLTDCEIIAIHSGMDMDIPTGYERIGFVFPVYFAGPPKMVTDFISNASFTNECAKYYFAVLTPGGVNGTPIALFKKMLGQKGVNLDYGNKVKMHPNYVAMYDMFNFIRKSSLRKYGKIIAPIISDIKNMKTNEQQRVNEASERTYTKWIAKVSNKDIDYSVNRDCISCGICQNICPASNISMTNGKPVFHHKCECCMACIQHCPKKAINYKNKTQKRKRYVHPDIGHGEISKYYIK